MSEHFIKNIEIKEYKLFNDFKADGFGRVNLIGGKNNVGKTAFMEACYLISNIKYFFNNYKYSEYFKRINKFHTKDEQELKEKLNFYLIQSLINIQLNRYGNDFVISWIIDRYNINISNQINILTEHYNLFKDEDNIEIINKNFDYGMLDSIIKSKFKLSKHPDNKFFYKIRENNNLPKIDLNNFSTICNTNQSNIRKLLSKIKKASGNKNELINNYLKDIFDVDKIDLTDDEIIIFKDDRSYNFSEFGDGIKSFIGIVLTLLYKKNRIIFIDEIENGIHYTNFDKLWELILTISKEQNVQVFATTHSKECIESYARVAKKLEDKEIAFIEMGINKYNKPRAIVMDSDRFFRELTTGNEVRGW